MKVLYNEGLRSCIEINFGEHSYMLTPNDALRLKIMLGEVLDCLPHDEETIPL